MRLDKMTSQLQSALADAQSLAIGRDHSAIESEHILLALIDQQGGTARPMLAQAGFNLVNLKKGLTERLDAMAKLNSPSGEISLGPSAR